ncbi:arginine--tRNA ligase [Pseudobutyrivibrio xylanivorans]|uniref:Arginine--tRNA ligase n=1 Tax=Pseudobutyrivibrio xylanivorans DSM 14809 TaxID=1123012 RepID=A0A1M6CGL5_PSEXY|nr:arginine--tRNA ligase [Pseudobutyrivibrio xylanivorans]SHI60175.1 arginyl-tRNA synthetase [Pseudobutyrivibrio xylanivorans DSM 14809]
MKAILQQIKEEVVAGFTACGYDEKYGMVSLSNRPDLCQFQCNGALAAAKEYKKAPIAIAGEVAEKLAANSMFSKCEACPPGFINMNLSDEFIAQFVSKMADDTERFGVDKVSSPKKVMIDYGGPNVAKPLHVGHLRSAIIGESIKRTARFMGDEVIGDVHLGDWGLQMGLIITELKLRKPELVYFDENYDGEYPTEPPFSITELEEIYPCASGKSKEDPAYKEAAMTATYELQHGRKGYQALLTHILNVSVTDLKRNYEKLDVDFDLWKGESDAQPYIPDMVQKMKDDGFAYISEGALVVDVKEDTDTKEVPPCMILKSDGASLYNTTDLATLVWRMKDYNPDSVIYVVDKRQELYFTQVFRCAKKTGIVPADKNLYFVGFGTMNGKDGKPFKTRQGGVMRLEYLLQEVEEKMLEKIKENGTMNDEEAAKTAQIVGLSAVKYGDLSNQASKDYIFDIDRFTSAEGNTGPYILYTIVRCKSILTKAGVSSFDGAILPAHSESERGLQLELTKFMAALASAYEEMAPHKICAYIYDLANAFNRFYHDTKILAEEDAAVKASYLKLLWLTRGVLEKAIDLLGFNAPERM